MTDRRALAHGPAPDELNISGRNRVDDANRHHRLGKQRPAQPGEKPTATPCSTKAMWVAKLAVIEGDVGIGSDIGNIRINQSWQMLPAVLLTQRSSTRSCGVTSLRLASL